MHAPGAATWGELSVLHTAPKPFHVGRLQSMLQAQLGGGVACCTSPSPSALQGVAAALDRAAGYGAVLRVGTGMTLTLTKQPQSWDLGGGMFLGPGKP